MSVRSVGIAVGLTSASCLFFLFTLEIGLRLLNPQIMMPHPNGMWELSPTRGCRLTTAFDGYHWYGEFNVRITISEQGLRDRTFGPKEANIGRILALGDSFTFGFGVEGYESYPKRLEALLNEKRKGYDVINAGFPGYGTLQELRYLEEEGLAFSPDVVLIGFFGFNDYTDNLRAPDRYKLVHGFLYDRNGYEQAERARQVRSGRLPIPFKDWLWAHAHSYRFLADRYRRLHHWASAAEVKSDAGSDENTAFQPQSPEGIPAVKQEVFDITVGYLKALMDKVRAHDAVPVLVMIPGIKMIQTPSELWSPTWFKLKEFSEQQKVPAIDLGPVFREAHVAGRSDPLWYPLNKHWKASGHRVAAEFIRTELLRQGVLPLSGEERS